MRKVGLFLASSTVASVGTGDKGFNHTRTRSDHLRRGPPGPGLNIKCITASDGDPTPSPAKIDVSSPNPSQN